jgi:hypothetical protein
VNGLTIYLAILGTMAFLVQAVRTYIAWREWRWNRVVIRRKYRQIQKRKKKRHEPTRGQDN